MKITYWSDYACPWCYIGEARLKKALAEMPEVGEWELEMKAFQLDPNAPDEPESDTFHRLAQKYGMTDEEAAARVEQVVQLAAVDGITMRYGDALSTNTMKAHQLTKLAQAKGDAVKTDALCEALYKAYFTDSEILADPEVMVRIGKEHGFVESEIRAMLENDTYKDEVILDEREAARYGIHAVPFFVIGRYGVSGAQSVDYFKAVLAKVLEEEAEAAAISSVAAAGGGDEASDSGNGAGNAGDGGACGPDGCPIR